MNYEEFLQSISFRLLKPSTPMGGFWAKAIQRLEKMGISIERANTLVPESGVHVWDDVGALCRVPKMSTFAIGAIIRRSVAEMSPNDTFVNVGVWNGFTFLAGLAANPEKSCIGVDNFSEHGAAAREQFYRRFRKLASPRHQFYEMDYREYFANLHQGPIGFYIYDGNHQYEHQLQGLRIAEPHFSENCVFLIDDTNWDEPRQATLDFISHSRHGYRLLLDQRTASNGHPTFWNGIMVFRRIPRNSTGIIAPGDH